MSDRVKPCAHAEDGSLYRFLCTAWIGTRSPGKGLHQGGRNKSFIYSWKSRAGGRAGSVLEAPGSLAATTRIRTSLLPSCLVYEKGQLPVAEAAVTRQ